MKAIVINLKNKREAVTLGPVQEEFGRVSETAGIIHSCLRPIIKSDPKGINRGALVKRLTMIQKTDRQNVWGERTVEDGDISLLEGHDLGGRKPMHVATYLRMVGDINSSTGICWMKVPALRPLVDVHTEKPVTHVRFLACAASFDVTRKRYHSTIAYSDYLELDEEYPELNLPAMVKVLDGKPIMLFAGLGLYFRVNGQYYLSLSNGGMMLQCVKTAIGEAEPC